MASHNSISVNSSIVLFWISIVAYPLCVPQPRTSQVFGKLEALIKGRYISKLANDLFRANEGGMIGDLKRTFLRIKLTVSRSRIC
jgi:hypothetical protein